MSRLRASRQLRGELSKLYEQLRAPESLNDLEQTGDYMPKSKLETLVDQLKVRACEMRSQALYYKAEADRLEECIRLLSPRKG